MCKINSGGTEPIKFGLKTGAALGLKLGSGYSILIALFLFLAFPNPLIFVSTLLYASMFGLLPAVFIGGLAGLIIGSIYSLSDNSLTEWQIVGVGWVLGIISALLLPIAIVLMMTGVKNGQPILFEGIIGIMRSLGVILVCPSIITVFAVGWMTRKIGENFQYVNDFYVSEFSVLDFMRL